MSSCWITWIFELVVSIDDLFFWFLLRAFARLVERTGINTSVLGENKAQPKRKNSYILTMPRTSALNKLSLVEFSSNLKIRLDRMKMI